MCRLDGVENLAAHSSTTALSLDLGDCLHTPRNPITARSLLHTGPKMYMAMAPNPGQGGTTKLHLDATDAVNIMTWCSDPTQPGAQWVIYPRSAAHRLRDALALRYPRTTGRHPIHAHEFYLEPEDIEWISERYHIRPWIFNQSVSQMVIIPVGCAHQVRLVRIALTCILTFRLGLQPAKCHQGRK